MCGRKIVVTVSYARMVFWNSLDSSKSLARYSLNQSIHQTPGADLSESLRALAISLCYYKLPPTALPRYVEKQTEKVSKTRKTQGEGMSTLHAGQLGLSCCHLSQFNCQVAHSRFKT